MSEPTRCSYPGPIWPGLPGACHLAGGEMECAGIHAATGGRHAPGSHAGRRLAWPRLVRVRPAARRIPRRAPTLDARPPDRLSDTGRIAAGQRAGMSLGETGPVSCSARRVPRCWSRRPMRPGCPPRSPHTAARPVQHDRPASRNVNCGIVPARPPGHRATEPSGSSYAETRYRETRTERFSVSVTPAVLEKLDDYADEHRWARSVAVEVLIEQGPAAWEASREQGDGHDER